MLIELYTRDGCSRCVETKQNLNEKNLAFIEYKIGETVTREEIKARFPDVKLLPILVVDGRYIENPTTFGMLNEV